VLSAQARARAEKGRKDHKQVRLRALLSDLRFPDLVAEKGVPMPLDPTVVVRGLHEPRTTPKMYRSAMYPALVAFERLLPAVGHDDGAAQSGHPPRTYAASSAVAGVSHRLFGGLGSGSGADETASSRPPEAPPPRERRGVHKAADPPAPSSSFLDGVVGSIATAAFGAPPASTVIEDDGFETNGDDDDDDDDAGSPEGTPTMILASARRPPAMMTSSPPYRVIVKNGDDLRQDQLVLQFILLMDLLLKRVNLDLKLTCFRALATGAASGLIEFVEASYPISAILADYGGSIVNFLRQHNPDAAAPDGVSGRARDNFTRSCAGYCVITYLLGVGDRHLDNIMVRTDGCLFHIDFGFILGKDPKPYPPPFRLTKEMAEAMGYPDDPNYTQKFKTKCCQAYTTLRKHAPLLLNLMSLMKDAGIEHLSEDSEVKLQKFQDRFRLDLGDEDAERFFLSLVNESLNAFVPVVLERFHKIAVWMK